MKFSSYALAFLSFSSSAMMALGATFKGTISVTNLAPDQGTFQTPVWVGIHNGNFDIYDRDQPASVALERLAEDGDTGPIAADFTNSNSGVWEGTVNGGVGPIFPGQVATLDFEVNDDVSGPLYFSYASMVLPSNDAFVANGNPTAHTVLSSNGRFSSFSFVVAGSQVLDAGTEVNDEVPENVAALEQSSGNTGVTEGGNVEIHPGFLAGGNILNRIPAGNFKQPNYDMMRFDVTITEVDGEPFIPAVGSGGDPHFRRWNGSWYDFMGGCDLILLQAPVFTSSSALTINVRTKIRRAYSYIESAVVKLGEDTFQVSSFGDYIYNGVSNVNKAELSLDGFPVKYTQPSEKEHLFQIQVSEQETISLKTFKDMVSVTIDHADPDRFRHSLGMMGSFDQHGAMLARDGVSILEDPAAMAAEWQVKNDEPMLFHAVQAPQHPAQCIMPDAETKEFRGRRLGESLAREAAEKACADWDEDIFEACVYDVMATGDLELAQAGAY